MADSRNLEQVRADIDAIDQEIQTLINKRAQCAQRVADIKLADVAAAGLVLRDVQTRQSSLEDIFVGLVKEDAA